jgi:hypothetical protein
MKRHGSKLLLLLIVGGVLLAPGVAAAWHGHTSGEWVNGLNNGDNSNYWVEPLNYNNQGHNHQNKIALWVRGSSSDYRKFAQTCTCTWNARGWDTSPVSECAYYSSHESYGSHILNYHKHYHHYSC